MREVGFVSFRETLYAVGEHRLFVTVSSPPTSAENTLREERGIRVSANEGRRSLPERGQSGSRRVAERMKHQGVSH